MRERGAGASSEVGRLGSTCRSWHGAGCTPPRGRDTEGAEVNPAASAWWGRGWPPDSSLWSHLEGGR